MVSSVQVYDTLSAKLVVTPPTPLQRCTPSAATALCSTDPSCPAEPRLRLSRSPSRAGSKRWRKRSAATSTPTRRVAAPRRRGALQRHLVVNNSDVPPQLKDFKVWIWLRRDFVRVQCRAPGVLPFTVAKNFYHIHVELGHPSQYGNYEDALGEEPERLLHAVRPLGAG